MRVTHGRFRFGGKQHSETRYIMPGCLPPTVTYRANIANVGNSDEYDHPEATDEESAD